MTLLNAIAQANELRPNALRDEMKAKWTAELEGEIAEMMEVEAPVFDFPNDRELLMPAPHDQIYVYYLCAMIDQANEEAQLYANDMTIANSTIAAARAWWRRHHAVKEYGHVRGLWE